MRLIKLYKISPTFRSLEAPAGAEVISVEYNQSEGLVEARAIVDDRNPVVTYRVQIVRDHGEVRQGRYVGSYYEMVPELGRVEGPFHVFI